MHLLSRPRRRRRSHEWTSTRAVTFIVTLAAGRSVTLSARESGMSRKAAYALKSRDPAFAAAWTAAVKATRQRPVEGDKVKEVEDPPVPGGRGNTSPSRLERERAFTGLIARLRDSAPLADASPAQ